MRPDLNHIIECLNTHQVRATYEAVGSYLRIAAETIANMQDKQRPEASWIVDSATRRPAAHEPDALHSDLFRFELIINSAEELANLIQMQKLP